MKTTLRVLTILTSSILLLFLTGCAAKAYRPVPGDYHSEEGYVIIGTDSLQIVIRPQPYRGSYQDLNSKYFTLWLRVRNLSDHKIHLPSSGFSIVAGGRQFDYIPLEYILDSSRDRFYFEQWEDPFISDPSILSDRERMIDQYYELLSNYFSFGELMPGAGKVGYLFYDRAVGRSDSLLIDALDHQVRFQR